MSIFPKRSVRGTNVTIHWNFNIAHLTEVHVLPFVRIGVRDPDGKVTMLFEDHVLGLPDQQTENSEQEDATPRHLNKNLPLMIIASYLEGKASKERLVEILQNIRTGRHYYFTYRVPDDAPLGKYVLVSEVHSGGNIKQSKTKEDDFFLVEQVTVNASDESGKTKIVNHSPEPTPVKIVRYQSEPGRKIRTSAEAFLMEGNETRNIELNASQAFLIYNEERINIPLHTKNDEFILRDQQTLELERDGKIFLLRNDNDEGYELEGISRIVWEKADGITAMSQLSGEELSVCSAMIKEGLIRLIRYPC